ncbi:MAG TPA: Clp protease N-terminal domain-containing protein [Chloroflexota bacterium]|nr:Clp protease N-terminal domain-containing protein [Chloroflexota bacterium]
MSWLSRLGGVLARAVCAALLAPCTNNQALDVSLAANRRWLVFLGRSLPPAASDPYLGPRLQHLEDAKASAGDPAKATARDLLADLIPSLWADLRWRRAALHRVRSGQALQPARDRFDRFTVRARDALTAAQREAQSFGHTYIGTEHLLLALLQGNEAVAARVLLAAGLNIDDVRGELLEIIGPGNTGAYAGQIGLTPRAKAAIQGAVKAARVLHHNYVGTEHLLLGLMDPAGGKYAAGKGIAAGLLLRHGLSPGALRAQVLKVLSEPPAR